jgi:hypothetical protein
MQNVHGSDGEPGNFDKSKPWWLTTCSQSPKTVYAAVHKHNKPERLQSCTRRQSKNGVGPENLLILAGPTLDKEYCIRSEYPQVSDTSQRKKCSEIQILSCIRKRVHGLINRQASENFFPLVSREHMNIPVAITIMLELCSQSFLHKTLW